MESLVHAMLSNAVAAAVLAVLVAIIGRACRRPALIHGLWLIVMLKLVTPPVVPVSPPTVLNLASEAWSSGEFGEDNPESIPAAEMSQDVTEADAVEPSDAGLSCDLNLEIADAKCTDGEAKPGSAGRVSHSSRARNLRINLPAGWSWEQLVAAVVLTGAVSWWLLAFVRIMRFHRLMQEIDPAPEEWQIRTAGLAGRLGLSEAPSFCLVPGRVPPMLWAIGGRPRLLVPSELWSETSLEQRTSLLLHELAHLKRRDHWVRWLELIVGGLYWWHPAVLWGRRLLREAEEQCCDAWVVWAMPQGAKTYATALLAAIEFVSGARTAPAASSAASGNGHVSCLKRRLKMIVHAQTPKGLSWAGRLAVAGTAALLLPLAPSWGQKSGADRAADEVRGNDPARRMAEQKYEKLIEEYDALWNAKHEESGEQLARLSQDDDRKDSKQDEGSMADKSRETAERFEQHAKNLIDKLAKELGPLGEELRKMLEKSAADVHESLKKEGATPEDLRRSLEKSHNEMRKAFEKGGTVNKELRETIERSRRDMQEEWDRARGEFRSEMRERVRARRGEDRGREAEKSDDKAKDAAPAAEIERQRAEIEKARGDVRTLEQQLRQAQRRLVELQRRTVQRIGPGGRRSEVPSARLTPGRGPEDSPSPRGDASPQPSKAPSPRGDTPSPRRVLPPGARQPGGPPRGLQGEVPRGSGARPRDEDRLRDLENKLERVLKELEELKVEKKSQDSKDSSSRPARPVRSRTPAIL